METLKSNNLMREALQKQTEQNEREFGEKVAADPNRLKLHIMPPIGWINDPNGLCQFHGTYHIFYQYSPLDAKGGMKAWGHITTKDFLHYEKQPVTFFPDETFDKDGVYSGSALVDGDKMYLVYTGNVKQEGNFDYVLKGREANTIVAESADGMHFSEKQLVMTNKDYPDDYTCHIRDPKVWKDGNTYFMVQGGRKIGDKGAILLFCSSDMYHWDFVKEMTTASPFGYMWECPDSFTVDGAKVLSFSPQGLSHREYYYQNVYQSGYLLLEQENIIPDRCHFTEWDMGFDFYAPQTFLDEKGRRILIGWAGIPDAEYDNEPTVEKGWQHALTLPRQLHYKNGKIYQQPVEEIKQLRSEQINLQEQAAFTEFTVESPVFEIEAQAKENTDFSLYFSCDGEWLKLQYNRADKNTGKEGIFSVQLSDEAGRGRKLRQALLDELRNVKVIMDTSMMEVYLNDGEMVFTTRFYFGENKRTLQINGTAQAKLWYLSEMEGL